MANPYQFWNHQMKKHHETFMKPQVFGGPSQVQTSSDGCHFSPSVVIERSSSISSRSDDDLISVGVKLSNKSRNSSNPDELPVRPAEWTFLAGFNTRILGPSSGSDYRVFKMPRSAYKSYFARNAQRYYIGTKPERPWNEEELTREFGEYQDTPLPNRHCWGM